jgi:hypothetical protein
VLLLLMLHLWNLLHLTHNTVFNFFFKRKIHSCIFHTFYSCIWETSTKDSICKVWQEHIQNPKWADRKALYQSSLLHITWPCSYEKQQKCYEDWVNKLWK